MHLDQQVVSYQWLPLQISAELYKEKSICSLSELVCLLYTPLYTFLQSLVCICGVLGKVYEKR